MSDVEPRQRNIIDLQRVARFRVAGYGGSALNARWSLDVCDTVFSPCFVVPRQDMELVGRGLPITPVVEFVAAKAYWSPLRRAIAEVGLPVVDGAIPLPRTPGFGIVLPDDLIAHFRIG